jgi:hypothetical protein
MSQTAEHDPSPSRAHRQPSRDGSGLALAVVALIALVALGLATWTLLRPAHNAARTATPTAGAAAGVDYTEAQRTDARANICKAFNTVRTGVTQNTNLQAPGGPNDVTGALAVAANARLSLVAGGQYLLARLDPATSPELADAIRSFANQLLDIGAATIGGAQNTDPEQATRLTDADAASKTIDELCK